MEKTKQKKHGKLRSQSVLEGPEEKKIESVVDMGVYVRNNCYSFVPVINEEETKKDMGSEEMIKWKKKEKENGNWKKEERKRGVWE